MRGGKKAVRVSWTRLLMFGASSTVLISFCGSITTESFCLEREV